MNRQKIILKWLNKEFGNLTPVVKGDRTFYVDKDRLPLFVYYHNQKNGWVYINYNRIWLFLESVFSMDILEIRELLEAWLEDTYNLRGYTPSKNYFPFQFMLENTYNLRGVTPSEIFPKSFRNLSEVGGYL
jgi:hypothetical protein